MIVPGGRLEQPDQHPAGRASCRSRTRRPARASPRGHARSRAPSTARTHGRAVSGRRATGKCLVRPSPAAVAHRSRWRVCTSVMPASPTSAAQMLRSGPARPPPGDRRPTRCRAGGRTCDRVTGRVERRVRGRAQLRHLGAAAVAVALGVPAAGVERAARRQVDQARRVARDRHQVGRRRRRAATARSPADPRCTGAAAAAAPASAGPYSTTRPPYMTSTSSATWPTTPRSWVIRMIAEPNSRLQVGEQVEDLRLDGDVERGGRLVGDQQLRVVGQRHRDHGALPHAAGELVRVLVDPARRAAGCRPGRACRWRAAGPRAGEARGWCTRYASAICRPTV